MKLNLTKQEQWYLDTRPPNKRAALLFTFEIRHILEVQREIIADKSKIGELCDIQKED